MNGFLSIPGRLIPSRAWALLQYGVIDVGALIGYGALAALAGLLVWRIARGSMASRRALGAAALALGIVALVGQRLDGLPPLYVDASARRIATPSDGFVQRLSDACAEAPLKVRLGAPDGARGALIGAYLARLAQRVPAAQFERLPDADDMATRKSLIALHGGGATEIPFDRLMPTNPAAPEGEMRRFLNIESELLQAVQLLEAARPAIYRLAGPEDEGRPTVLMDAVRGITADALAPLDLSRPVPEDCAFVIVDDPRADLTERQASLLRSYLGRGGRLLLITDYAYGAMPNLNLALEEYGLRAIDGAVLDPGGAMGGRAEYPVPTVEDAHAIGRWLGAAHRMPLMPLSHAIDVLGLDGVDAQAVLETTDEAYCQLNGLEHASLDVGEGDLQGPFALAVAAQSGTGKVVWLASADMMSEDADADCGGANAELLLASMRWLMDAQVEPLPAAPLP